MPNPNALLSSALLDAFLRAGKVYFVRNSYRVLFNGTGVDKTGNFIITHYDDEAKARAHYNAVENDRHRFYYDWNIEEHRKRLQYAATQPENYRIYSTLFIPGWKNKISRELKEKLRAFVTGKTNWQPGKGEALNTDLYWQFGQLYVAIHFRGEQLKCTLDAIIQ